MNDPDPSAVPPPPPAQVPPASPALSRDERMWAMIGHLSALVGLATGGIGCIVGPLIIWQVKKDSMPFAASEAKEALNFNISWLLWYVLLIVVVLVLTLLVVGVLLFPLLWALPIVWAVFVVIAGLKANEGTSFRYPLTIRFI